MAFYSSKHSIRKHWQSVVVKPAVVTLGMVALTGGTPVEAGPPGSGSRNIAERERARREAQVQEAQVLIAQGAQHLDRGNYQDAMRDYRQAHDLLPDAPLTADLRAVAREGYSRAAVGQARKLAGEARYAEARALLQGVLADDFNPGYGPAVKFQEELEDADRFEPALTPEHLKNVEEVSNLLRHGNSFINLGDYDSAEARFEDALRIDKYNKAARRGMERVAQLRTKYYTGPARDHTRADALSQVDAAWEKPIPLTDLGSLFGSSSGGNLMAGKDSLRARVAAIILPQVNLQSASLDEVVEFLRIRSREVDPLKRGIDIVMKAPREISDKQVTLQLVDVPFEEVLRYATEQTGAVYRMDEYAVTITSHADGAGALITKSYRVSPDFIQNSPMGAAPTAAPANPFDTNAQPTSGLQIRRMGAREFLEERGVTFGEGASASYIASSGQLTVRNNADNLAIVDALVDQAAANVPKQVLVQVKMMEINETRLTELGFDWLMGQFNVPGSENVFVGGGTTGNQRNSSFGPAEFPFSQNGVPVGGNPLTAGLRGAGSLNNNQSIDTLIGRANILPADSRSSGTFSVSGVFTDPQFQTVLRALNQSKGIDVMAAPSVVAKSGETAKVTISRELIYPTEFEPPQIPQSIESSPGTAPPVTPTTPTAFETRETGIIFEVQPVVENRTVSVVLAPVSTEFEGFIDYGTDIVGTVQPNNSLAGLLRGPQTYTIQNDILQPIFRVNKVNTSVTVWDGQTVVLGGVKSQSVKQIEDKVPFLGSLPVVGRAFQSKATQVETKNVIFFVTVKIIDPSGSRLNNAPTASGADATVAR